MDVPHPHVVKGRRVDIAIRISIIGPDVELGEFAFK